MKYLHTMVRVSDVARSLKFYCDALGLVEVRRHENEAGRTCCFLGTASDSGEEGAGDVGNDQSDEAASGALEPAGDGIRDVVEPGLDRGIQAAT